VCVCVSAVIVFCSVKSFHSLLVAPQPYCGLDLLNVEVSRSLRHTILRLDSSGEGLYPHTDLYLTKHGIYKRQTTIHSVGFELAVPSIERRRRTSQTARLREPEIVLCIAILNCTLFITYYLYYTFIFPTYIF
jgi:hypothetical protein